MMSVSRTPSDRISAWLETQYCASVAATLLARNEYFELARGRDGPAGAAHACTHELAAVRQPGAGAGRPVRDRLTRVQRAAAENRLQKLTRKKASGPVRLSWKPTGESYRCQGRASRGKWSNQHRVRSWVSSDTERRHGCPRASRRSYSRLHGSSSRAPSPTSAVKGAARNPGGIVGNAPGPRHILALLGSIHRRLGLRLQKMHGKRRCRARSDRCGRSRRCR